MAKRIDSLKTGDTVSLHFHGSKRFGNEPYDLDGTFLSIQGEGDDRRAFFDLDGMEFQAYRYNKYWAYGTSAERLSLN